MLKRLISMNIFPRKTIEGLTGHKCEQSIVCVGNTMERIQLKQSIDRGKIVLLFGSGKLTAAMWVIDELNLSYEIDYSGEEGFDDRPLFTDDVVYVMRYHGPNSIVSEYIDNNCRLILLCDEAASVSKAIRINLNKPTQFDIDEYTKLKGEPMIVNTDTNITENIRQQIVDNLRRGTKEYVTEQELWYSQNFKDKTVLKLCALANECKDIYWKAAVLNMIRYKRPIDLKPPNYGRWK